MVNNPWYTTYKDAYDQAPAYYHMIDDGAPHKCEVCNARLSYDKVLMTFAPGEVHAIICMDCIDDDWLARAKDLGKVPLHTTLGGICE